MKLFLSIVIFINLTASTLNLKYVGELSIFGKVGDALIVYENDGQKYHIKVEGGGRGIVASLTNNKRYIYESIGSVKNGELIPLKYIGSEISKDFNKTKTYFFDYENAKTLISTEKCELKSESTFNIGTFNYDTSYKIIKKNETETLNKIYKDDMVSMFFNKSLKLLNMEHDEEKIVYAVGSEDTQNGMLVKLKKIQNEHYTYSIRINKDYLEGGSEEASFVLDKNNVLYETKLEGILFFGDATIKRQE